jgi:2-polyprenyl-3-methyl-5-hydroxy-6-metoxy-1,4-benzoquinol methylase
MRRRKSISKDSDLCDLAKKPDGYYESVREDMLKYIPETARTVLEFGCGCGGFTALVKEKLGAECWAVEIDKAAAKEAEKKLDKVINADATEAATDIPNTYFDCIVFLDVLEHLVNPYSLLLTCKEKLTSSGVIVASIPNIRYYRTFMDFVVHGNWDYRDKGIIDKTHLRFFTRNSILKMFNKLGFTVVTCEGIHPTHSRTCRVLNVVLFNALYDTKYRQFVIVAKPRTPRD